MDADDAHPAPSSADGADLAFRGGEDDAARRGTVNAARGPTPETRSLSVETPEISTTCPRCGAEYTGGDDSCPVCGLLHAPVPCDERPGEQARFRCVLCGRATCTAEPAANRAAVCEEHASVPVIESWAQVYSTGDGIEAGLIAQNLQAEGIDAQVYDQKDDNAFPVDLGELAIVRVLVPVWDFAEALDLVTSYMDGDGEVGFACPSCGEVYEPGQTQCGNCGASLVE
jgi:Putative prokaryotic signal transducing protein